MTREKLTFILDQTTGASHYYTMVLDDKYHIFNVTTDPVSKKDKVIPSFYVAYGAAKPGLFSDSSIESCSPSGLAMKLIDDHKKYLEKESHNPRNHFKAFSLVISFEPPGETYIDTGYGFIGRTRKLNDEERNLFLTGLQEHMQRANSS